MNKKFNWIVLILTVLFMNNCGSTKKISSNINYINSCYLNNDSIRYIQFSGNTSILLKDLDRKYYGNPELESEYSKAVQTIIDEELEFKGLKKTSINTNELESSKDMAFEGSFSNNEDEFDIKLINSYNRLLFNMDKYFTSLNDDPTFPKQKTTDKGIKITYDTVVLYNYFKTDLLVFLKIDGKGNSLKLSQKNAHRANLVNGVLAATQTRKEYENNDYLGPSYTQSAKSNLTTKIYIAIVDIKSGNIFWSNQTGFYGPLQKTPLKMDIKNSMKSISFESTSDIKD